MRALIQRVKNARVTVEGRETGSIGQGLLIFLGIRDTDSETELRWMVKKCAALRVFEDDDGKMNRSVRDIAGEALVVSQFTLYGNSKKGNRPSYIDAARPEFAEPMYERFCDALQIELGRDVATGEFGADMQVELTNDGPVTLWIERESTASRPA